MAKDAVPMEEEKAIIIKTDAQLGDIDDNFEELKVAGQEGHEIPGPGLRRRGHQGKPRLPKES